MREMRESYEPYVHSLSDFLLFELPTWLPNPDAPDNWQTSAWDHDTKHF